MKSNSINIREQNTYIDENESLGFVADTTIKILCITAYPGVLAADIVKKFPRVISGIMAFCLFSKSSAYRINTNNNSLQINNYNNNENRYLHPVLEECNKLKPRKKDIQDITKHTNCLLAHARDKIPERVIETRLPKNVYKNIQDMSYVLPAVSVLEQMDSLKENNHSKDFLRFILGVPVSDSTHHELSNLCGLREMFDAASQAKELVDVFIGDIKNLINDKELTEPMVEHFQYHFLKTYRDNIPKNMGEAIKLGFNTFWNGGPTESALLIKALDDIDKRRERISWSPQTIHSLTLISHAWESAINIILPEKSALDSIIALGKSITKSRTTFCDYVRTAASVGAAISTHPQIKSKGEMVGRIHSTEQIRKNAYHLNDHLHRHQSQKKIPSSELITADLEHNLKDAIRETQDKLSLNDLDNNSIKIRCKRAGVRCIPFRRRNNGNRDENSRRTNRVNQEESHINLVDASAGLSYFKENPSAFLHENSLVSGYFEDGAEAYFNRISDKKYQISTTKLSDSVPVSVEYLKVIKEDTTELNNIPDVNIDDLGKNIIATPLLTGCTMALKIKNGKRYLSHVQPVSETNTNRHLDLQKELTQKGYETYGPQDYREDPTRFFGIKEDNNWHFYTQKLNGNTIVVKEVFKTRNM